MQNIGDNNVETPSTFEGMELEKLPNEVVLMVLGYVGMEDLFACRLVCTRLGALALHPAVWRHRQISDSSPLMCPVLRLAPCLATLKVELPSFRCHPLLLSTTKCTVVKLVLAVRPESAVLYALIVRHQQALGQLRCLQVLSAGCGTPADSTGDVFWGAVASTAGLRELSIGHGSAYGPFMTCHVSHNAVSEPSIRHLVCGLKSLAEPLLRYIMAGHAVTLEDVAIFWDEMYPPTMTTILMSVASLLAGMPNLRVLTCPLIPGLEAVAACELLERVKLNIRPGTPAGIRSAVEFLRRARRLRVVHFMYSDYNMPCSVCGDMVAALASGPSRTMVESLSITTVPWTKAMPAAVQTTLLAALPLLPALRSLTLNGVPEEVMMGIKPTTASAMKNLVLVLFRFPKCRHSLLHVEAVQALLAANLPLQLLVPRTVPFFCADTPCDVCAQGCHQGLLDQNEQRFTSRFVPIPRGVPQ